MDTYKKLIIEMLEDINDEQRLKRIFDLISYLYLQTNGKHPHFKGPKKGKEIKNEIGTP